jgi:hypothetical protein
MPYGRFLTDPRGTHPSNPALWADMHLNGEMPLQLLSADSSGDTNMETFPMSILFKKPPPAIFRKPFPA